MSSNDGSRPADGGQEPSQRSAESGEQGHGPSRRRFLGVGILAAGSLAYVTPAMAVTRAGTSGYGAVPIPLPFHHIGPIPGGPAPGTHRGSMYSWTGTARLDIDVNGIATLQSAVMIGNHVSGTNFGTVTVSQQGVATGNYQSTQFDIPGVALTVQDSSGTNAGTGNASGQINQQNSSVNGTATTTNGGTNTTVTKNC